MPNCLDGGRFTIVGFGTDYMVITMEDDCPGCISGGGMESIKEILKNVNCVFIALEGMCYPDHPKNHVYLYANEARKLFPQADKHWFKTQRSKSVCPKTFAEFKQFLEEKRDLTPATEDTTNRHLRFSITSGTKVGWSMAGMPFGVYPDGGSVEVDGDKVKFLNFGYRYVEGMSPIRFEPETVYHAEAVEWSDTSLSFIDTKHGTTYYLSDLKKES